jgi:hypothetical protein
VDVNKSHDDKNGGAQREKIKRVWQVARWRCILHPQLRVENRDMSSRKESNELFSGQDIGKARMLASEESRQSPSRGFWARRKWRRRNICKESRKGVREECENSREFHREEERGWCFLGRSSGNISLACGNLWCEGHPSYPVYAIAMAKDL